VHGLSVKADPKTGGLTGLPQQWRDLLPEGCALDTQAEEELPEVLRPTAQPKPGTRLHDEVVIGQPFNVCRWKPQFGMPMEAVETESVNGFDIPIILVRLYDALQRHDGLNEEGIFRLAPDAAKCEAMQKELNTDREALDNIGPETDKHVLANLIKVWFRMMPTRLLSGITSEQIRACQTGQQCMALLQSLVPMRKGLFLWLCELMADVAEHGDVNRMSSNAVAIVIAPNLYDINPTDAEVSNPMAALVYTQGMARFVTQLLEFYMAVRSRVRESRSFSGGPAASAAEASRRALAEA